MTLSGVLEPLVSAWPSIAASAAVLILFPSSRNLVGARDSAAKARVSFTLHPLHVGPG